MELRTYRKFAFLFAFVIIALVIAAAITEKMLFAYLSGFAVISYLVFSLIFCRCPACGKYIPDMWSKCCQHCGERVS